jgi:hypothetical protein
LYGAGGGGKSYHGITTGNGAQGLIVVICN